MSGLWPEEGSARQKPGVPGAIIEEKNIKNSASKVPVLDIFI
jgi:hypothetical protein